MKINILNIGKQKEEKLESYKQDLIKRISPFATIEEVSFSSEEKLLSSLNKFKNLILLDVHGVQLNSKDFSFLITEDISFIIGPHNGFDVVVKSKIKEKTKKIVSLSLLTFPHQLCKIILIEQVYRAFCIIHNHPYAK